MDKYFRGKKVLGVIDSETVYSHQHMGYIKFSRLDLDGEDKPFMWCSAKHESPTTEVPRAYREHINQQLLEDVNACL